VRTVPVYHLKMD